MNKEEFNQGINFFYDPITMSIETNILLVLYEDKELEPRIMSTYTYEKIYRDTVENRNKLACYKWSDVLTVEQMEEMNTLENQLRVHRGNQQGNFLNEDQFNCPMTRSVLTHGDYQDAKILLEIFIFTAFSNEFSSPEMEEFLSENKDFLEEAGESYIRFIGGEIELKKEQMIVLERFGIDCSKAVEPEIKQVANDEKNIVPNSSFFTPIWQNVRGFLFKRNRSETTPDHQSVNKRQKFN